MAQWKETLEPYIRVQERIKTAALNPVAGEDLIIGAVVVSDSGPSTPTLITSQSEFISTYASKEITEDYIKGLNKYYDEAAGMWANAYRLAGSNTMLVVRATKGSGFNYISPIGAEPGKKYIIKNGVILEKIIPFRMVLDEKSATFGTDGWGISISGAGRFGNYRTEKDGIEYDEYVSSLPELVSILNDLSSFLSPEFQYEHVTVNTTTTEAGGARSIDTDNIEVITDPTSSNINSILFKEVYIAKGFLNEEDWAQPDSEVKCYRRGGLANLLTVEGDETKEDQAVIDIEEEMSSVNVEYYVVNTNNTASDLTVRIRRFNHDAVVNKEIAEYQNLNADTPSPYSVLGSVLASGVVQEERDFYEVAIYDRSISENVVYFNVGSLTTRGDIDISELNSLSEMIQFYLPDTMKELGLDYYGGYMKKSTTEPGSGATKHYYEEVTNPAGTESVGSTAFPSLDEAYKLATDKYKDKANNFFFVKVDEKTTAWYEYIPCSSGETILDLEIPEDSALLNVSLEDLKAAVDRLENDEIYTTEGLCDLGCMDLRAYLKTLAINGNYFYPISTVNKTDYYNIGYAAGKFTTDSPKLYYLAPWDIDTLTLGWKFYTSPGVIYWEAVARNRRNNQEFRPTFGQVGGIVQYQRPTCEFNKTSRQMLLSKKVNTVLWNPTTQAWNINDNYTTQNENTIMNDEANSRLMIRISKAQPVLLKQFIGRRITEVLCKEIWDVIDYWFTNNILTMEYNIDGYQIICNYDEVLARQNKVKIIINVRYQRALKYVEVVNNAYDIGMEFEE